MTEKTRRQAVELPEAAGCGCAVQAGAGENGGRKAVGVDPDIKART